MKYFSQVSRFAGRDLNLVLPDHEAGMPYIRPRLLILPDELHKSFVQIALLLQHMEMISLTNVHRVFCNSILFSFFWFVMLTLTLLSEILGYIFPFQLLPCYFIKLPALNNGTLFACFCF
jgi:hypothetical protein